MAKQGVDIVIVGAGLIGSALALWLAKHTSLSIALVERNQAMEPPAEANQRVVALGTMATDFLREIAVLDQLGIQHCNAYHSMTVWDENSAGELHFNADAVDTSQLGHMVDSLQCNYLCQQLVRSSERIDSFFAVEPQTLQLGGTQAKLTTNEVNLNASLVIAADGAHSWVRQQAGIFSNRQAYQQRGIVTRISTERPHQNCAWQRFLSTGPLAILPLADNQSSIVWSADNDTTDALLKLNDDEFSQALQAALDNRLGKVSVLSKRAAFPLYSQRCESYYAPHVALIGDAAHSIHPLAGLGANLGFKDALCLGQLLAQQNVNSLGHVSVLSRYQMRRQRDNQQTDALMSALHTTYQIDAPLWMALRGLGMNLIDRSDTLRELLSRQAMGI